MPVVAELRADGDRAAGRAKLVDEADELPAETVPDDGNRIVRVAAGDEAMEAARKAPNGA